MAEHRRTLKRYEGAGDVRYITCSCYQRLPLFQNDKIKDTFGSYLNQAKDRLEFKLYAWVLMPEHFHLLVRPASPDQTMSQILRGIKAGFAKLMIRRWRELDASILERIQDDSGTHRFWQAGGGYDRNITSELELIEKIGYIHRNPVTRGLVERPVDWVWFSALWYEQCGSYRGPGIDELS